MQRMWKTFRAAAITVGCLLTFFVVVELIRAYEVLSLLHHWVGYAYATVIIGGTTALCAAYAIHFYRNPPTLVPPHVRELEQAEIPQLHAYARYLARVMRRVSENPDLPTAMTEDLAEERNRLRSRVDDAAGAGLLLNAIRDAEDGALARCVSELDLRAEREVRRCVRDVMLGVTLSPWRSMDLLVVLYRNMSMITRITSIYNTRPRLREHARILRDVATVVATVNFLNYGSRLSQNLLASVPFLGRFSDDVAQGIGAGLLTSVAGHAALTRCHTIRGWDKTEAQATVRRKLTVFVVDIKKITIDDMLPQLRRPMETQVPESAREPGWIAKMCDGITGAIDDTNAVMDSFVRQPVVAAGRGVARTGSRLTTGVRAGGRAVGRATVGTSRAVGHGIAASVRGTGRLLQSVGRGIAKPFRRKKKTPADT